MTSNTPDHETSPDVQPRPHDDAVVEPSETESAVHDGTATASAPGIPTEPVQPTSTDDVYDGASSSGDDLAGEEREPFPIGATDAEPAPATEGPSGEEIVIDYGSHQEPDHDEDRSQDHGAAADVEPPLTKPAPAEEHHPYPPQALSETAPVATGVAAVPVGSAAPSTTDRDEARDDAPDTRSDDAVQRPVYVQAPTPPKKKGNRGFGVLVGVLATLVFGALYFVALLLAPLLTGADVDYSAATAVILTSAAFYVPVVVFFLAWVLLIVVLTRAPWWGYVIGGFVVAILTYAGFLAGVLIQNAYEVAPSQVPSFLLGQALAPGAVLAFVIAREVPIWFGVWVGKRGRVVKARNAEAREEYERVLEAGPAARA